MTTTTWVLVADRTNARIFNRVGRTLALVREFDHPAGRTMDQDLESGRARRSFDGHARGTDERASPHEHAASDFAKSLARELRTGRLERGVARIVLVAEPHFLGLLRAALDEPTAVLVTATLAKDLAKATPDVIGEQCDALLGSAFTHQEGQ